MTRYRTIGYALAFVSGLLFFSGTAGADDGPPGPPPAGPPGPHMMMPGHRPYGGYCQGPRWGWYGARQPVRTKEEARRHLEKYFEGQNVQIGVITPRPRHFLADILDKQDKIIDRVIIDRRTGRIRSLY